MNKYEELWKALKKMLDNWHKETKEEKEINEKQLYLDLLEYMEVLERRKSND